MRALPVRYVFAGALLLLAAACGPSRQAVRSAEDALYADTALDAAVSASTRTPANVARDRYRHPKETLAFFGVDPRDTVVEIWPGGGWYTEILAPLIGTSGAYYAAAMPNQLRALREKIAADPATYANVRIASFPADTTNPTVPNGSADVVLTFRNVHNWMGSENRAPIAEVAFREMYAMLRPGGTLGVVEHRLPDSGTAERETRSGYMRVATVRRLAEAAGFRFVAASEINANPRDTADHPNGVWSLPPTYRGGDADRARFAAIGESDRMTLRFIKPR